MKTKAVLIATIMMMAAFVVGCAGSASRPSPSSSSKMTSPDQISGKIKVWMMGRSVMAGWFGHWGSDTSTPVKKGRFVLSYKELSSPPDIADSAADHISEIEDENTVVFFKFCFVDFSGGSREEARQSLKEKKEYVDQVYDAASDKKIKLIIGNALPMVKSSTDAQLVWNHRQFNQWLEGFANEHQGQVIVFDQYGILADAKGNLKAEYSIDGEDSHLNDRAYNALDKPFFDLLDERFK